MDKFAHNQNDVLERYLTPDQEKQLFATVKKCAGIYARRDEAWMRALLYSGLRITEFSLLNVGDALDALKYESLFIPKEHRKGYKADAAENKADDHRQRLHEALRAAMNALLAMHRALGGSGERDAPLVLSRKGGARMSVRAYQDRFKVWVRAAGLPERASPHWMRHTSGVKLYRASTAANALQVVQRHLGHRSLDSTAIYATINKEDMDQALEQAFGAKRPRTLAQRRKVWEAEHG
jgi:site-specific recombinase XerC